MNLYFRMLVFILKSFFAKSLDPHEVSIMSFRVLPSDIDINLHLNNGRYLTMMDIGRLDFVMRTGLFKLMLKKKWLPVAVSVHITFLKELNPWTKFELQTRIVTWDDKWFYLEQNFIHNKKIHASAIVKTTFREKGKIKNPHEITNLLKPQTLKPEMPLYLKELIEGETEQLVRIKKINQI
jgi:acyl-CoA thioesterase FadM